MKKTAIAMTLFCTFVLSAASTAVAAGKAALPKGYQKWAKSSEKVVTDKNSLFYGIHYIYVDARTMKAYQTGGPYPEGSQFVVEYFNIRDEGGKPVQGKKNMIVLMKKDKKRQETGGWLYAGFNGDGTPSMVDPVKNCYECHLKEAKDRGFVISRYAQFR
jgi:hypothetical protein